MKLTTKTTYGMRAVIDLAQRYNEGPQPVSSISRREDISISYLEQLLNKLKRNNIVRSTRGPRGGYILAKKPSQLNVYDIVRVLEGDLGLVICMRRKNAKKCNKLDNCVTKLLWQKLNNSIEKVLKSLTLKDLCEEFGELRKSKKLSHKYTYNI